MRAATRAATRGAMMKKKMTMMSARRRPPRKMSMRRKRMRMMARCGYCQQSLRGFCRPEACNQGLCIGLPTGCSIMWSSCTTSIHDCHWH